MTRPVVNPCDLKEGRGTEWGAALLATSSLRCAARSEPSHTKTCGRPLNPELGGRHTEEGAKKALPAHVVRRHIVRLPHPGCSALPAALHGA